MSIAYDSTPEALFHPERRATVFGTGSPLHPHGVAVELARLAYVRAEEGGDASRRLSEDLAKAGFGEPALFNDAATDSQGYAALREDGSGVVAFRGTQADRLMDSLVDLGVIPTTWPPVGGNVHHGFARAASALWPQVQEWLARTGARRSRLLVCGHSLGAALATLLAVPAGASELVTIGSPRVGDGDFKAAFERARIPATRIVDFQDVVTRVPPSFLFGYCHVGDGLLIDADGKLAPDAPPSATHGDIHLERAGDIAAQSLRHVELPRELTDHAPVNYLRAYWP
jgi:hypothetical protein